MRTKFTQTDKKLSKPTISTEKKCVKGKKKLHPVQ